MPTHNATHCPTDTLTIHVTIHTKDPQPGSLFQEPIEPGLDYVTLNYTGSEEEYNEWIDEAVPVLWTPEEYIIDLIKKDKL